LISGIEILSSGAVAAMNSKWHLENVEQASRNAPGSFNIPLLQEREALEAGKLVRLHFVLAGGAACRAERMWVRVKRVSGGRFHGELLDVPVIISNLSKGAEIEFDKTHVASILIPTDDPQWIDETKLALVTNRVLSQERPVGFLYRENPDSEHDSGWRIFAGDEDQAYVDNPANIQKSSLGNILDMDESLRTILNKPVFSAFERAEQRGSFKHVKDFHFGRAHDE
jgi:hypothetical protein